MLTVLTIPIYIYIWIFYSSRYVVKNTVVIFLQNLNYPCSVRYLLYGMKPNTHFTLSIDY